MPRGTSRSPETPRYGVACVPTRAASECGAANLTLAQKCQQKQGFVILIKNKNIWNRIFLSLIP
jgi:hypothetical protein